MNFSKILVSTFSSIRLDKLPVDVAIETLLQIVKEDPNLLSATDQARQCLASGDKAGFKAVKSALPAATIATTMKGGHSKNCIVGYTGLCICDFDHLDDDCMQKSLALLAADCHTVAFYRTVSGHGIRVVCAYNVGEKPLSDICEADYKEAFYVANMYYSSVLGVPFDPAPNDPSRLSFLAHDNEAFLNEGAMPFCIPTNHHAYTPAKKLKDNAAKDVSFLFRQAVDLVEHRGVSYEGGHNNFLVHLIPLLNRMGIVEADVADLCIRNGFIDGSADGTVAMVHRLYEAYSSEHASLAKCFSVKKTPGRVRSNSLFKVTPERDKENRQKKIKPKDLIEFINQNCKIRYNTLTCRAQFFSDEEGRFLDVTDNYVNSLYLRIIENEGVSFSITDLYTVINSDRIPSFDPLKAFLDGLPAWNEASDPIGDLFSYIDTPSPELLCRFGRMWIVNMVKCWLGGRANQIVLELIGRQNIRKSTFFSLLLPPELSPYFVSMSFTPFLGKDDYLRLAQNGLICIDEMGTLNERENALFKNFVTLDVVDVRPAYGRISVKNKRVASLCATSNTLQFLNDSSGDRRHLPFIATDIHLPASGFDYTAIYSQALALARDPNYIPWLTDADLAELDQHMQQFRISDEVTEAILSYFRTPTASDFGSKDLRVEHLSCTEIRDRLTLRTNARYSVQKIGNAMNKMQIKQVIIHGRKGFNLIELSFDELQTRRKVDAVDHYLSESHAQPFDHVPSRSMPDDNDDLFDNNE